LAAEVPHCVSETPATHVSNVQQPFGQFCGVHFCGGGPSHLPFCGLQELLLAHAAQAPPAMPHAPLSLPPRHPPPAQQPLQLFGPHCEFWHWCVVASQSWPDCVQSAHAWPPDPHAPELTPEMQVGLPLIVEQQPVGQVSALHS